MVMVLNIRSIRHPELVSGSILPCGLRSLEARWMLKQVQHDGYGVMVND
tara:strand:- start:823 stop:969 length:147 start_codon:yes stop_codon:yes gene_type:complete